MPPIALSAGDGASLTSVEEYYDRNDYWLEEGLARRRALLG